MNATLLQASPQNNIYKRTFAINNMFRLARTPKRRMSVGVRDLSWKDIARTQEVGTTESVRDLSGDDLSSQDKEYYINDINIIHP